MEAKRRMTLGQIENMQSSLPISSVLRKQSTNSSFRPSYAQPPGSVLRSSSFRQSSIASFLPPGSVRRSSTYRQSSIGGFLPPGILTAGPSKVKDPRPLREKAFRDQCIRNIVAYLMHSGYPHPITPKNLTNPIKNDFENMFKYLYNSIDPGYHFTKKIEDEVLPLMKGLKYPFADSITKSSLQAVGSMTTWPSMLAMLHWMVELSICMEQLQSGKLDRKDEVPSDEKIFYEYLTQAYKVFLAGDDDFAEMEKELAENFDRKNQQTIKENERLERDNELLLKKVQNLDESPLDKLEKERQVLQSDKEKFLQYINHLETKKTKLRDMLDRMHDEVRSKENEIQQLVAEKANLQAQVDAQEISPADVDRMTSEREQLSNSLDAVNAKAEIVKKKIWELEIAVQKKLDSVERILQDYQTLGYRIGILPRTAPNANGVIFEVEFNPGAPQPENIISGDIDGIFRPELAKLKHDIIEKVHEKQEEAQVLQETLDKFEENSMDKREELEEDETRLKGLVEQYNEAKEAMNIEVASSNAEASKIERELSSMKTAAQASLLAVERRSQSVNIEYDQLVHNSNEMREELAKEVVHILDDIIKFKLHVQNELESLETLVQAEWMEGTGMIES